MIDTAYDTTACSVYVMKNTVEEIERHRLASGNQIKTAHPTDDPKKHYWGVYLLTPGLAPIAPFAHPLVYVPTSTVRSDRQWGWRLNSVGDTIVDVRNFCRLSPTGEVVITAPLDYQLAVNRGVLQQAWMTDRFRDLLLTGNFQVYVFQRWISGMLKSQYDIEPTSQYNVSIIAAYYYLNLFAAYPKNAEKLEEKDLIRMATTIASVVTGSVDDILRRIENFPLVRNVTDFVELLKTSGGSQRFEKFNVALLFAMVRGAWFGASAPEIMQVSLEHPPTWVALVLAAISERGYQNLNLGRIVHDNRNSEDAQLFLKNAIMLLRSYAD